MEELKQEFDNLNHRIGVIRKFMSLFMRRSEIAPELSRLQQAVVQVEEALAMQSQLMGDCLEKLEEQYETLMDRMRSQQLLIQAYTLQERARKVKDAQTEQNQVKSLLSKEAASNGNSLRCVPTPKSKILSTQMANMRITPMQTPRTVKMTLSAYKDSPLARSNRIKPMSINFAEFEADITPEQFDMIPKYMRGRETLDELNTCLRTVIIPCFNEKYRLLNFQRSAIKNPQDLELWKIFNDQNTYLPGRYFITPGDIARKTSKMLDKKLLNRIVMLRHLGILQEQRVEHTICYIWILSNP